MAELTPEEKQKIYEEEKERLETQKKLKSEKKTNWGLIVLLFILVGILFGFFRVYYGEGVDGAGIKVVTKSSFSFKDTIVNLDDILGMPRIAVASNHPSVKRQLEKMGIIETDEQVAEKMQKKFLEEYQKEYNKIMEATEKKTKELQRQYISESQKQYHLGHPLDEKETKEVTIDLGK